MTDNLERKLPTIGLKRRGFYGCLFDCSLCADTMMDCAYFQRHTYFATQNLLCVFQSCPFWGIKFHLARISTSKFINVKVENNSKDHECNITRFSPCLAKSDIILRYPKREQSIANQKKSGYLSHFLINFQNSKAYDLTFPI